jgi:HD-GYP domain-containing protein (c-di-GMP phosphodiesterase class II)
MTDHWMGLNHVNVPYAAVLLETTVISMLGQAALQQQFFAQQLPERQLWVSVDVSPVQLERDFADYACCANIDPGLAIVPLVQQARQATSPITWPLCAADTLVVVRIPGGYGPDSLLISSVPGSPKVAELLVRNALQAWAMQQELVSSRQALEESAMQLAQSFEEHNWLHGIARNASSLSHANSANAMARGILQPLGYLLRAQDTYLIVDPEENYRSGLTDSQYGGSNFSIHSIRHQLETIGVGRGSPPCVKNNVSWETPAGPIRSLVAVPVSGATHYVGHLVAINRGSDSDPNGLPVYDPEFGSNDVGLLEEAAVLVSTQAHNIHLLLQSNQLFLGTLHAMSSAIDARDAYTQGHSQRVARLAFELAKLYGLTEAACQEIYLAGILHDIGKIGIPDSVLLKNGPLTEAEYKTIQQHPQIGHRIVEQLGHLQFVLPGILYHHERWDGAGYPHGLHGESIPVMARILAVADAFDAMSSSRPYRSAMPIAKAHSIICQGSGKQWETKAVDCFKLWLSATTAAAPDVCSAGSSIIPVSSPVDLLVQACLALGR